MAKMSDKALLARDSKRDIGTELLQSVRDLNAGRWGRRTTIETLPDGTVRRRIELMLAATAWKRGLNQMANLPLSRKRPALSRYKLS